MESQRYMLGTGNLLHLENLSTISNLYRFALVLTKNALQAERLVGESVREVLYRGSGESARRIRWLIFQKVRQRALSQIANEETGDISSNEIVTALHALPEPSRSAMTLLCLESFSLQDLESLLDLSTQELGEALKAARSRLKHSLSLAQTPS